MSALDVAVVTVTYNSGGRVLEWAHALQRAWDRLPEGHGGRLRVLAVDNASPDDTVERLKRGAPWVEVVSLPINGGFATGCNVGLRAAGDRQLFVLLNPDVLVAPDFFSVLAQQRWTEGLAALGPSVRTPGGEVEQSARVFPRASTGLLGRTTLLTRLFPGLASRRQLRADPDLGRHEVDWVSGACMIISAAALARVGEIDERYFMYWEDADWCRRAHDLGMRVVFEPALAVIHHQGTSSATRPAATTLAFHRSAYRYYRTHVARTTLTRLTAAALLTLRCTAKLALVGLRSKRSG